MSNETDLKLLDKCLNTAPRYNIPEHLRSKMIGKLSDLMQCGRPSTEVKAVQTLVNLDKINVDILKTMKPKRSESMVVNVTKLTDVELIEAIRNAEKYLPLPSNDPTLIIDNEEK